MKLNRPTITLVKTCECGESFPLNSHAGLFANRPVMCPKCMRKDAPRPWTKQLYAEYLKTLYWQDTRKRALDRAGHRCQVCASTARLEVHHNSYENLGGEPLVDLVVLCRGCHELFHEKGM